MTIKLEVGKRYELNNGEVVTMGHATDPREGFYVEGVGLYFEDGTFGYGDTCRAEPFNVRRCLDDEPTTTTWQAMARELIEAYGHRFSACVEEDMLDAALECIANVKALEAFIGEGV